MKKILLIAYTCTPGQGSEHEMGLQWIKQISTNHVLEVACANFNKIGLSKIKFKKNVKINYIHEIKIKTNSIIIQNFVYFIWSFKVSFFYLFKIGQFDIVHHATLSPFRFLPFILIFAKKTIIGPISGYDFIPKELKKYLPIKDLLFENFREISIKLYNFLSISNYIYKKKKIVILNNNVYLKSLGKINKSIFITLVGTVNNKIDIKNKSENRTLLFVGRLVSWKGIGLLLIVFKELIKDKKYCDYKLILIGRGPYENKIIDFIKKNNLEKKITLKGYLKQTKVMNYYKTSKLLMMLSFRDSCPNVILESFKNCLPVFCLDTGGAGIMVNNKVGYKINLSEKSKFSESKIIIKLKKSLEKKYNKDDFKKQLNYFLWQKKYNYIYNHKFINNDE